MQMRNDDLCHTNGGVGNGEARQVKNNGTTRGMATHMATLMTMIVLPKSGSEPEQTWFKL